MPTAFNIIVRGPSCSISSKNDFTVQGKIYFLHLFFLVLDIKIHRKIPGALHTGAAIWCQGRFCRKIECRLGVNKYGGWKRKKNHQKLISRFQSIKFHSKGANIMVNAIQHAIYQNIVFVLYYKATNVKLGKIEAKITM